MDSFSCRARTKGKMPMDTNTTFTQATAVFKGNDRGPRSTKVSSYLTYYRGSELEEVDTCRAAHPSCRAAKLYSQTTEQRQGTFGFFRVVGKPTVPKNLGTVHQRSGTPHNCKGHKNTPYGTSSIDRLARCQLKPYYLHAGSPCARTAQLEEEGKKKKGKGT